MQRDEITAIVTDILCDVFDLDRLDYADSLSAADIEDWDSLSNITFLVAIEKRFGFRLTTAEIGELKNVGDLVDRIAAHVG